MKFRLTYAGVVKSSGNKNQTQNKHEIRHSFNTQLSTFDFRLSTFDFRLSTLWESNPVLKEFSKHKASSLERAIKPDFLAIYRESSKGIRPETQSYSELLIDKYKNMTSIGILWLHQKAD